MTREEAIQELKTLEFYDRTFDNSAEMTIKAHKKSKALDMAIKALEQEPKTLQFAKWVASEIFDEMWEYNKDAFAEIACRKLAKLGIVRENGDAWELVEPQESEESNG